MPIGDPVYSDEESDLSDYAGPDDDLGFDFNFRTPIGGLTVAVPPTRGGERARLLRGTSRTNPRARNPRLSARSANRQAAGPVRSPDREGTLFAYGCDDGVVRARSRDTATARRAFAPSPTSPGRVPRFASPASDNANVCVVATSAESSSHHHLASERPRVADRGGERQRVRAGRPRRRPTFAAGRDEGVRVRDERTGCASPTGCRRWTRHFSRHADHGSASGTSLRTRTCCERRVGRHPARGTRAWRTSSPS